MCKQGIETSKQNADTDNLEAEVNNSSKTTGFYHLNEIHVRDV